MVRSVLAARGLETLADHLQALRTGYEPSAPGAPADPRIGAAQGALFARPAGVHDLQWSRLVSRGRWRIEARWAHVG
jgi:hypothetical protein